MLSCERTPVCHKRRHLTLTDIFGISNIHRLRCEVSVCGGKNFRIRWQGLPRRWQTLAVAGFALFYLR
jgi:hypothetical protein